MSSVSTDQKLLLTDTVSVAYKPLDSSHQQQPGQPIQLGWWESFFWRPIKVSDGSTVLVNINNVRDRLGLSREATKDLLAGGHQDFLKAMVRGSEAMGGLPSKLFQDLKQVLIHHLPQMAKSVSFSEGEVALSLPKWNASVVVDKEGQISLKHGSRSFDLATGQEIPSDVYVQAVDQLEWLQTEEKTQLASFFRSRKFRGAIENASTVLFQRRGRDGMPRSVFVVRGEVYVLRNRCKQGDPLVGNGSFTKIKTAQQILTGHIVAYGSTRPDGVSEVSTREMQVTAELPPTISNQPIPESIMIKTSKSGERRVIRLEALLEGDLIDIVDHSKFASAKELPRFWISLFAEMARVLKEMHELGYVHRDVKPDNYLFGWQGDYPLIKMGDMGFAVKKSEVGPEDAPGSHIYASPEFIDAALGGKDMRAVTTEQHEGWALGVSYLLLLHSSGKLNLDLSANPALASFLAANNAGVAQMLANRQSIANSQQDLFAKPADENSLEFVIWNLLRTDPANRWTPAQAYEALARMQPAASQEGDSSS